MCNRQISRFLSIFILVIFFIAGVYQSFDLADSFFVCQNENPAVIYEESFIDFTQDVFVNNSSLLTQFTFNREESIDSFIMGNLFWYINLILFDNVSKLQDICFGNILQENCLKHFSRSVITNYIHLKDGQKIA